MSIYGKKPLQYCKVISLQLIKVKEKKKKKYYIRIPKQDSANILQIRKSYTNINFIQKQPNDTEKHGVWGLKIYFLFCDFCPPPTPTAILLIILPYLPALHYSFKRQGIYKDVVYFILETWQGLCLWHPDNASFIFIYYFRFFPSTHYQTH